MASNLNLKEWSEKTLSKDDWNFSHFKQLPKSALSKVFLWELDRELGSGKGPFNQDEENKKWLADVSKGHYANLPVAPVTSKKGQTVKTNRTGLRLTPGGGSTLHLFQINWHCSQQELIEAFAGCRELPGGRSLAHGQQLSSCRELNQRRGAEHLEFTGQRFDPGLAASGSLPQVFRAQASELAF